ncbi:hypothetical protein NHX12_008701 [Muraenolepis orangiensis]|uniref:Uncharacterized protein n=1 Tax=Muraenolepis orangiensis TaxID=630683 RepID=A0A9Q0DM10_9TELE|nr:hypothetical protein NHX12_008701 [Muraenolepis orangiensis]
MAPSARPSGNQVDTEDDEDSYGIQRGDRKTRKPFVERKRRARINDSLQELRNLLADTDLQSKMENAEVLEMTVKKVEDILQNRTQETDALNREASERFAAGYVQCMHEVHMFVSSCPGVDATVAAELLNHLLESMPLNEDHLQDALTDLITDTTAATTAASAHHASTWPRGRSISGGVALSPAPSPASSSDPGSDPGSDPDTTDSDQGVDPHQATNMVTTSILFSPSMWRPW